MYRKIRLKIVLKCIQKKHVKKVIFLRICKPKVVFEYQDLGTLTEAGTRLAVGEYWFLYLKYLKDYWSELVRVDSSTLVLNIIFFIIFFRRKNSAKKIGAFLRFLLKKPPKYERQKKNPQQRLNLSMRLKHLN